EPDGDPHRRAGTSRHHLRDLGEPRIPGHPATADDEVRRAVRKRLPLSRRRRHRSAHRRLPPGRPRRDRLGPRSEDHPGNQHRSDRLRPRRHPRRPRTGGHRRSDHLARRPPWFRSVLGCGTRRGCRTGMGLRAAHRLRKRSGGPEMARLTTWLTPLDKGALAKRIRAGEMTVGSFAGLGSTMAVEVLAAAGLDWILVDLEHGGGDEASIGDAVAAAGGYGAAALVRVETPDRIRIGRALDAGAAGIMLPRVNSAAEVAQIVPHLHYP